MKDISAKIETYREAQAAAFITMPEEAKRMLRERKLEKGDALEIARMAGIVAAKRTPELIPFCHGILITQAEVGYRFEDEAGVEVLVTVKTMASTGVEMEALTAASIAALTLYDMLKPHTTELAIRDIRLLSKLGGKSDYRDELDPPATVSLIGCGKKRGALDHLESLLRHEPRAKIVHSLSVNEPEALRREVERRVGEGVEMVLTVGGTGLVHDDFAVEVLGRMIDREIPGILEAARAYGQKRTPYAMLSRGISGLCRESLIVTFPGSTRGVKETHDALFPALFHIVSTLRKSEASRR